MKLEIRFANKNDLKIISRLVNEVCIHDNMWLEYTYDELIKEFDVMFNEKIEKHDWIQPTCLIAEYDNEIIGMINYRQAYMAYCVFEIGWCMIKPKFQNSFLGVGYKLCKLAIENIKQLRPSGIIQVVSREPKPLIKYGFVDSNILYENEGEPSKILYYKF